jgi:hypothetical protein
MSESAAKFILPLALIQPPARHIPGVPLMQTAFTASAEAEGTPRTPAHLPPPQAPPPVRYSPRTAKLAWFSKTDFEPNVVGVNGRPTQF